MRGELISWSASLHLPLLSSRLLAASFKSSSPSLSIHTLLSPLEFEIGSLMLYEMEELLFIACLALISPLKLLLKHDIFGLTIQMQCLFCHFLLPMR